MLVTSRRRTDAPDPAYRLDLQPLAEQEAMSVVQAFGGVQAADVTATSRICERVGNLPLALRLVGRYLAEQEEEASDYLAWLQNTPLSALDQGTSRQESVPVLLERTTLRLSATAQQVLRGADPAAVRTSASLRQHVTTQLAAVQTALDQMLVDQPRRRILRSGQQAAAPAGANGEG